LARYSQSFNGFTGLISTIGAIANLEVILYKFNKVLSKVPHTVILVMLVIFTTLGISFSINPHIANATEVESSGNIVLAEDSSSTGGSKDDTQAQNQLRSYTLKQLSGNSYEKDGGGSISGVDMFTTEDGQIDVNQDNFSKLDKKGKREFAGDLNNAVNSATEANKKDKVTQGTEDVTTETGDNWISQLAKNPNGWGSIYMGQVMSRVATPDWVSAGQIIKPFNGVIGTATAFFVLIMLSLLFLSISLDLIYITLPFFRKMGEKEGGSSIFSREAINAVKGADGGEKKTVVIVEYLKTRIIGLFFLFLTIILLISGQLFPFISQACNLLGGLANLL
jgi:hypothetical protein